MVGELVASWAGRMDLRRVGWRAEGWEERMAVVRAG